LAVTLITATNAGIKSMIWSLDGKVSMSQNDSHDTSECDQCGNTANSTEEIHDDDGELLHQKHFAPFGYSIFIPMDPILLGTRLLPPLKRPPKV